MLFYPFDDKNKTGLPKDDIGRVIMELSVADYGKIKRGCEWQAKVTDLNTGKKYRVRDADCGAGNCRCAARVVSVLR